MKKTSYLILLLIMFIPVIVKAETCDIDKITIKSITMENKSDSVTEVDEPIVNGRNVSLGLGMNTVGDSIEYKIVVKNDSNEDYELNKDSLNIKSEYIDYIVESDDNKYIVKANSSKTIRLKVVYSNPVPADAYQNGSFNYNKKIAFNLSTEDKVNNPNTGLRIGLLILFISMVLIISTILIKFNKNKSIKYLVLISLIVIPSSVYAICKCDITLDSNITIEEPVVYPEFCYTYEGQSHYLKFEEGMTWGDYVNSSFNNNYIQLSYYIHYAQPYGISDIYNCYELSTINGIEYGGNTYDQIKSSEVGCYDFVIQEGCK